MAGLQPLHAAGRAALLLAAAWLAGCATAPGPDAQISGTVIVPGACGIMWSRFQ